MTSERLPSAAPSLARLVQELTKLPGIGPKSAQRLAYYIIQLPNEEAFQLADAVYSVKHTIMFCEECQNLADANLCGICSNPQRDRSQVCVVEEPMDVLALERANCYYGLYHVLHGAVSPLNGVTPAHIKLKELYARLSNGGVSELVIATNPTLDGDATALLITRQLEGSPFRITRLARGLPIGGSLEHSDETTLSRAFTGRQES